MEPEIKFCGMTRREDITAAGDLGADYVGVIFAGGPRAVSVERAGDLMHHAPPAVKRVGVFGPVSTDLSPAEVARSVGLDVIQLHGDPDVSAIERVRREFGGQVWAALRIAGLDVAGSAVALFRSADAVVIDAYSPAGLGGTGVALPWEAIAERLAAIRTGARLVLAGGLRADTVAVAIGVLQPDVVDVSSGVEAAPGIKDHGKLRAFRDAVRARAPSP